MGDLGGGRLGQKKGSQKEKKCSKGWGRGNEKVNLWSLPWSAQGHEGMNKVHSSMHHPSILVHWWVLLHFRWGSPNVGPRKCCQLYIWMMKLVPCYWLAAKMNQQPLMHQLAILSIGWAMLFHFVPNEVHHSPLLFYADHWI
jgi:hypothetical protein